MTAPEPSADRLVVAIDQTTAYIHVVGRGSFKVGTGMKQFGVASIERGCHQIVLDMAECTGMDSTFMGVVAGLAFRMKQQDSGTISVVNLSTRNRNLLSTLGLDQVVDTYMQGATPEPFQAMLTPGAGAAEIAPGDETREHTARTMLEAHEHLVNLSPENLPKFKDVLTFLREDLRNELTRDQPGP